MAFASGQKITASDYNALLAQLNAVYGTGTGDAGYGATELPDVDAFPFDPNADKVKAGTVSKPNDLTDLVTAIDLMGQHQGDVPTLPTINQPGDDIEIGDPVQAFTEIPSALTQVTTNRLLVDAGSTTITSPTQISIRTDPWATQIQHIFTVDFSSDDNARWFFNTGGQIRLAMSAPDNIASHNWGGLYNAAGTFIFNAAEYYGLSPTINNFTTVLIATAGGGVYSSAGNQWIIQVRFIAGTSANGARGSKLEFTSLSDDVYSTVPDIVTGTFTSTISERRSTAFFLRPSPTFATTSELGSFSPLPSGYEIDNSFLYNQAVSARFNRTPSIEGDRRTWTFSCWLKRTGLGSLQNIFSANNGLDNVHTGAWFTSSDTLVLNFGGAAGAGLNGDLRTTNIFVDTTSWYNFVFVADVTNFTASDRLRIYANGIRITDFGTENQPNQSLATGHWNTNTKIHRIGAGPSGIEWLDGYMTEIVNVDGQALDPTSFGEFDSTTGEWIPVDPSGLTFGTNGFWLDHEDNVTADALGLDVSGNGNNFTAVNISTNNQTVDTPTVITP